MVNLGLPLLPLREANFSRGNKVSNFYAPELDRDLARSGPELGIAWTAGKDEPSCRPKTNDWRNGLEGCLTPLLGAEREID